MAKVAIVVDAMFEDSEFRVPYDRLKQAGHEPVVIGVDADRELAGKKGKEKVTPDVAVTDVRPEQFDALVVPGGFSPDKLRMNDGMVALARGIHDAGKPVAAICHAGWLLVEADIVKGRTVTSYPSIKTDLINAGAEWVDREVVEDGNLITSRTPDDLDAFCTALLGQLTST